MIKIKLLLMSFLSLEKTTGENFFTNFLKEVENTFCNNIKYDANIVINTKKKGISLFKDLPKNESFIVKECKNNNLFDLILDLSGKKIKKTRDIKNSIITNLDYSDSDSLNEKTVVKNKSLDYSDSDFSNEKTPIKNKNLHDYNLDFLNAKTVVKNKTLIPDNLYNSRITINTPIKSLCSPHKNKIKDIKNNITKNFYDSYNDDLYNSETIRPKNIYFNTPMKSLSSSDKKTTTKTRDIKNSIIKNFDDF